VFGYKTTGTHTGEFRGLPPTGKKFTETSIDIFRIVNGKLAEGWSISDEVDFLKQAMPSNTPNQTSFLTFDSCVTCIRLYLKSLIFVCLHLSHALFLKQGTGILRTKLILVSWPDLVEAKRHETLFYNLDMQQFQRFAQF